MEETVRPTSTGPTSPEGKARSARTESDLVDRMIDARRAGMDATYQNLPTSSP